MVILDQLQLEKLPDTMGRDLVDDLIQVENKTSKTYVVLSGMWCSI